MKPKFNNQTHLLQAFNQLSRNLWNESIFFEINNNKFST